MSGKGLFGWFQDGKDWYQGWFTCMHAYIHTYMHAYIVSVSELLCLIPILVGSSIATVCPPERDTALRTAVTNVTRVPL